MRNKRVIITKEDIDAYARQMKEEGKSLNTARNYRRMLSDLYDWLPENKHLGEAEITAFLEERRAQYSVGTINNTIAAFNGLMRFLDHQELRLEHKQKTDTDGAVLTREEYLRLLAAGRRLRDRGGYVLIKLFGNTTLRVQELERVTVEAVSTGVIHTKSGEQIPLPGLLCQELLDYAELEGVGKGSIFRTRSGNPIDRTAVHRKISELGEVAELDSEKVNPRSLRRLHMNMMRELEMEYQAMIGRSYEHHLEGEQHLIGWTEGLGIS